MKQILLFYHITVEEVLFNNFFVILESQNWDVVQIRDSGLAKTAGISELQSLDWSTSSTKT